MIPAGLDILWEVREIQAVTAAAAAVAAAIAALAVRCSLAQDWSGTTLPL